MGLLIMLCGMPMAFFLVIVGYSDANWAKNVENRKCTSGVFFFIGDCLMAWLSKKQNSISLSIAKAEYIAIGSCCTELLWMKQMLKDYGIEQGTRCIYCDNTSPINISKNLVLHSRTKDIEILRHCIRKFVEEKCCFFRICLHLTLISRYSYQTLGFS